MIFTQHLSRTDRSRAGLPAGTLAVQDTLVLPFEQRQKARQRARLTSGLEVGIQLPRGTVLRGGDCLRSPTGVVVEVIAALEGVSTVRSPIVRELACAAYHIGNRHVALQVGDGWLRYSSDHVLDAMVEGFGLDVVHERQPFEPEAGAYSNGHGHAHYSAEHEQYGHEH